MLGLMHEVGYGSVPTFTVGFADRLYDERPGARLAAERYGTDHHELVIDGAAFLDVLPRLSWHRHELMAELTEAGPSPRRSLPEATSKVVLLGDGGDQLFGGYPKYRAERILGSGVAPTSASSPWRRGSWRDGRRTAASTAPPSPSASRTTSRAGHRGSGPSHRTTFTPCLLPGSRRPPTWSG